MGEGPRQFVCRTDGKDDIVFVDEAWSRFARDNWRPDFDPSLVLGRSLWSFVSEPATRQILGRLCERLRSTGRGLTLPFRCDSPDRRRHMEMTVEVTERGGLLWRSHLLAEEARPAVDLLRQVNPLEDRLLVMCSWCKRVLPPEWLPGVQAPVGQETWLEVEEMLPDLAAMGQGFFPNLSHGICQACHDRVMAALVAL